MALDGFDGGGGWGGFGGGFGDSTTTEHDYKERTLVLDTYDAKSKQLIWQGSTEDAPSDKPEKNEKNLVKGVEKMFKDSPRIPEALGGDEQRLTLMRHPHS